jgi:hypothetical protein
MSLWAMRSVLRAMPHNVGNVHGGMRAMRSATAASRTAMVGTHMQRQFMRMSYATAAPNGGQQTQQKKEEGKADEGGSV